MNVIGELALLAAFVCAGFGAIVQLTAIGGKRSYWRTAGNTAAVASALALSAVVLLLGWALILKDFDFAYVAQYSSQNLPWYYSLSALWVGQAGSLLLWAWFTSMLSLLVRYGALKREAALGPPVFGLLLAYQGFLIGIMVFAADPMAVNIATPQDGAGLSPLLQHPAMLIHPPIVFLGYALWTVPFALAAVALVTGRLDATWIRLARPWALLAWVVLGAGILLGADWAYEELGWGGYWSWDPVENGSLMPWLTGTAFLHGMMAWQYRGVLKRATIALAFVTFGLCNFATFLTRSGIFSSLHAFSESPIGWLFLVLMLSLAASGAVYGFKQRHLLVPERPIRSVFSREACIVISTLALVLLSVAVFAGTVSTALSSLVSDRPVMVGPAFYNAVLVPTGLVILLTMAAAPLLRWSAGPTAAQRKWLWYSVCGGVGAALAAILSGNRQPILLAVAGVSTTAVVSFIGALVLDARRLSPSRIVSGVVAVLRVRRTQYAGFVIHLGFAILAVGIAASSLGKQEQTFALQQGETVEWAGRQIQLVRVVQHALPDKRIAEAEILVSRAGATPFTVKPAQHFHRRQEEWTTEVAIQSTWSGDFYAILHSGDLDGQLVMTFVENPLMRWVWSGGLIMLLGTAMRLWPRRRRARRAVVRGEERTGDVSRDGMRRLGQAAVWLLVMPGAFSFVQLPPCFPERNAASYRTFQNGCGISACRWSRGCEDTG